MEERPNACHADGAVMKLVLAVVQAEDAGRLLTQLSKRGFRATRIQTVGGFLRETNTTVFVGVEAEEVETVVQTIRAQCTARKQRDTAAPVEVGRATIFVLNIEQLERA
jgi:uncharacterized protein YaaQ